MDTKTTIIEELIDRIDDASNLDEHDVAFALENFLDWLREEFTF